MIMIFYFLYLKSFILWGVPFLLLNPYPPPFMMTPNTLFKGKIQPLKINDVLDKTYFLNIFKLLPCKIQFIDWCFYGWYIIDNTFFSLKVHMIFSGTHIFYNFIISSKIIWIEHNLSYLKIALCLVKAFVT